MPNGILGDIFDFNRDGHLDCIEQAAEFAFLQDAINRGAEANDLAEHNTMPDFLSDDDEDSF